MIRYGNVNRSENNHDDFPAACPMGVHPERETDDCEELHREAAKQIVDKV